LEYTATFVDFQNFPFSRPEIVDDQDPGACVPDDPPIRKAGKDLRFIPDKGRITPLRVKSGIKFEI